MMRKRNCQVVLTNSDQLGLPLLYTYEHKFSLKNGEMEEVSADYSLNPFLRWDALSLSVHYFHSHDNRFPIMDSSSSRFISLSPSLLHSSEGSRLKMPPHSILPRWSSSILFLWQFEFPPDRSIWPPDFWWGVRRLQAVRRWLSWDRLHFPLLSFLGQQSFLYIWINWSWSGLESLGSANRAIMHDWRSLLVISVRISDLE